MFECYKCHQPCKRLIARNEDRSGMLYGDCCFDGHRSPFNWQLHDIVASDGMTKVTKGKASEIDNRMVSPEDRRVVINKLTGRPTQR